MAKVICELHGPYERADKFDECPSCDLILANQIIEGYKKAVEEMPRWIPISESIPKAGETVLVCFEYEDVDPELDFMDFCADYGNEYWSNHGESVKYWMRVPKHPKVTD